MAQATLVREREEGRVRVPAPLAIGAGSGLLWGVAARVWMRLIAEDPAFTWSGTLFIVGAATVVGLGMGLAAAARRNRWRLRRTATVFGGGAVILLGAGAGFITLPTIILGGLALTRPRITLPVRLAVLGLAGLAVVATGGVSDLRLMTVAAVIGVLLITGYHSRIVIALVALAPVVGVVVGVLMSDVAWWQRIAGGALYPALLAPMAIWFGRTVAPFEGR
jgi:hypothetical protein